MHRIIIAILLLCSISFAQSTDRVLGLFGGSYQLYGFQLAGSPSEYLPYYGLTGGIHYVLKTSGDNVSLSANPMAELALQFNSYTGANLYAALPLYGVLRIGARSTFYNTQKFGIGVGAGARFAYLNVPVVDGATGFMRNEGTTFISPGLVGEITFLSGGNPIHIRANMSLMNGDAKLAGSRYTVSNIGFGIMYGL